MTENDCLPMLHYNDENGIAGSHGLPLTRSERGKSCEDINTNKDHRWEVPTSRAD